MASLIGVTVGGYFSNLVLTRVRVGRASEAVDEIMGVARDDDTTAGTEVALINLARLSLVSGIGLGAMVGLDGALRGVNTFSMRFSTES